MCSMRSRANDKLMQWTEADRSSSQILLDQFWMSRPEDGQGDANDNILTTWPDVGCSLPPHLEGQLALE